MIAINPAALRAEPCERAAGRVITDQRSSRHPAPRPHDSLPAGGRTTVAAEELIPAGCIPRDESIVISVTGNGYKTLEAVLDTVEQPFRIPARLGDFDALYARLQGAAAEASAG
jgi:hypothetical protein